MDQQHLFCENCGTEGAGSYCNKCGQPIRGEMVKETSATSDEEELINIPEAKESFMPQASIDPLNEPLPYVEPLEQPHKSGVGKGCLISVLLLIGFIVIVSVIGALLFGTVLRNLSDGMFGIIQMNLGELM